MERPASAAVLVFVFLLVGLVSPGLAIAQKSTRLDVLAYGSPLVYQSSRVKGDGWSGGAYAYLGAGARHGFEAGFNRTRIGYVDSTHLDQSEVTVTYGQAGDGLRWRVGAHLITSDDTLTHGGSVFFIGFGAYEPYVWSTGLDLFFSRYDDYFVPLRVVQLSPVLTWSFGDPPRRRYVYVELRGHLIVLGEEVGLEETTFLSAESAVSYIRDGWTFTASVWSGEQSFAVRQNGFTVFNLSEKHTGGYGVSARRVLNSRIAVTASVHNEQFRDFGYPEEVSLTLFQLALGVSL